MYVLYITELYVKNITKIFSKLHLDFPTNLNQEKYYFP